ncbi:pectin lyase-like protein [Aspergillus aculeatinus CBS 121060]|uniref:Pectin lyase-like protein n=1 Tax=Aspergillus aculeatinus CBS 121060 TaxID=1448322 RepID=A0ACD1HK44_9EURO|nr:pectin lyase-like protein [Aspergillus aculeatinus CBS 121060]RAH73970.1 pectin lyase-like protein [Aspergillus aculeatinus CBS 121060]
MVALTSLLHVLPLLLATAQGQLAGRVGPLTSAAEKNATRTCNVLDYGAVADNATDVGQPIIDAFADCGRGGVIYIPPGDYLQTTWVHLTNGSAFAIQLDGIIYRGAAPSSQSYMFEISSSSDFEVFSSTSRGAIQGSGYLYHQSGNFVGPRLLHVSGGSDWSVHDLALVDSPMFHFVIQGATNGEVYNMAIRGGDHGGLDGIDVSGTDIWIHDVMVTNKDECVTVKTGSKNILVESIYCNSSGGCAMGSLGAGTNVSDVTYRNVYTWSSNQMFMIKSNGGSGSVSNVLFENFMGHGNAYSLDFDTAWSSMSTIEGDGIAYSNITFRNWKGTEVDGEDRPLIKVKCPALTPCTDLAIEEFALWNEEGNYALHVCEHSYGSGYCLSNATVPVTGTAGGYTTTQYINTPPAGYSATTMAEDLATAFGTSASIPIPTIPTSFYPGLTPYSPLAGASAFPSIADFFFGGFTVLGATIRVLFRHIKPGCHSVPVSFIIDVHRLGILSLRFAYGAARTAATAWSGWAAPPVSPAPRRSSSVPLSIYIVS